MLPYQERVIEERDQLRDRVNKLDRFVWLTDDFQNLPLAERMRLVKQLTLMKQYWYILDERINAFSANVETGSSSERKS